MRCPACHSEDHKIVLTREGVRRTRQCKSCAHRFTTHEGLDTANLMVTKREGRPEAFSRRKLAESIQKAAVNKLPSSEVADLVFHVVEDLFATKEFYFESKSIGWTDHNQLSTRDIGDAVMRVLDSNPVYRATRMRYGLLFARSNEVFTDAASFLVWLEEDQRLKPVTLPAAPKRVVKRSGATEDFNAEQLYRSIKLAIRKRPVEEDLQPGARKDNDELAKILSRLILERVAGQEAVTSAQLATATTWVLLASKDADLARLISDGDRQLAYLRVVSSAKRFTRVEDFQAEATLLIHQLNQQIDLSAKKSTAATPAKSARNRRSNPAR